MSQLVLASASPRRRGLLRAAGFVARVVPSDVPEVRAAGEDPVAYARRLAEDKARAVASAEDPDAWVLAADTVVHIDGQTFEKPADAADAMAMLTALAGRWHAVTSAWCLAAPEGPAHVGHSTTRVRFRSLGPAEVAAYVAAGESLDKAGAYGVQGLGAALVDRVDGCYSTVVGLPMAQVVAALGDVGIVPVAP